MKKTNAILLPKLAQILADMGENIKLARLRRKLTAEQVSERAGISRSTLWQVEKGESSVSMGIYAQVLFVLGLEKDLSQIASNDILGRKLQDAELLVGKRAPKNKKSAQ
ncbi:MULTISPECIES: helix-turn-helix domain-containing protein [unclassified Dysgonomonas]|uniref:helix-turn-helix domain-containing protein n=1 Tax=unclassified Dysgonomonas TaxID=2630389 RepID=UPI0013EB89E1|nr:MULTISPECIES: helix-turn-helix transcriptional regulator [unclassified Dysgonomonas]